MFRRNSPRTISERLEKLFEAARETEFYGSILPLKGEMTLENLPCVTISDLEASPHRFLARRRQNGRVELRYPIQPEPVVKSLIAGFTPKPWLLAPNEMGRFDTLAGPAAMLRRLAATGPLRYPCIAFSGGSYDPLNEEDREFLWRCFRVPVFEQLVGFRGEVLAEECEAHCGLHVREDAAIFEDYSGELVVTSLQTLRYPVIRLRTGMSGHLEHRPCGCGASSPRLVGVASWKHFALAATTA